jgi:hypothetical protein
MRLAIALICIVILAGCSEKKQQPGFEPVTGGHVSELEQTACDTANDAGTCETKLASLGFITKEQCCERYGKCC